MKQQFKKIVASILGWQVRRLRKKNQFKIIGVVGSIGKTSTKLAIAQVLSKSVRVQYQEGNYNDIVSVPLVLFGHIMPDLLNPIAWLKIFIANEKQLHAPYPFDVVVLELGTDAPGQIATFKSYLQLDYAVLTSIAPEHMEFFQTLQAVAEEETSVKNFANTLVYNADFVDEAYRTLLPAGSLSYGIASADAQTHIVNIYHSALGLEGDIKQGDNILLHISHEVVSKMQLYSVLAAVVVAQQLGIKPTAIHAGIALIRPVSGRLRRLRGINNSVIIDDTYNASPAAVKAGLDTVYEIEAPQKIVVLGNMNELGASSAEAHTEIGNLCDPKQLALVVTIGPDANAYLAPAAEAKGCNVKKFDDPYLAGEYLQGMVQGNAVIFAKGSQNGVFAEETIKTLLADPEDASKLVRQSDEWQAKKRKAFARNG